MLPSKLPWREWKWGRQYLHCIMKSIIKVFFHGRFNHVVQSRVSKQGIISGLRNNSRDRTDRFKSVCTVCVIWRQLQRSLLKEYGSGTADDWTTIPHRHFPTKKQGQLLYNCKGSYVKMKQRHRNKQKINIQTIIFGEKNHSSRLRLCMDLHVIG